MREHIRAAISFLKEQGANNIYVWQRRGKHPKLFYTLDGHEFKHTIPSSPGDSYRCSKNIIAQLRRSLYWTDLIV